MTLEEYETLSPYNKGIACYEHGGKHNSVILYANPYPALSINYHLFEQGKFAAMSKILNGSVSYP